MVMSCWALLSQSCLQGWSLTVASVWGSEQHHIGMETERDEDSVVNGTSIWHARGPCSIPGYGRPGILGVKVWLS